MSEHDVALGFLFGAELSGPAGDTAEGEPVRALRAALRPALSDTPCVLAFSGGRDSSLLLASLVTGDYGDEVLGGHRANVLHTVVRRRGRGLSREAWGEVMLTAAPEKVRRAAFARRIEGGEWLRPAFRREWRARRARHAAAQPLRWDASVRFPLRQRAAIIGRQTLRTVASWYDCKPVEPLGSPGFVASLAAFGSRWGIGGRSACVRLLADGLLPEAVIERRDKAYFNASRFGTATADFVRSWDGSGLNDDLVNAEVLREVWSADFVPAPTAMLLQHAWLSTEAGREQGSPNVTGSPATSRQESRDGG